MLVALHTVSHGSLLCDGHYYYQFDAWNRVAQVSKRGTLDFSTNGDGRIVDGQPGDLGPKQANPVRGMGGYGRVVSLT
jgi:hypothetical protein